MKLFKSIALVSIVAGLGFTSCKKEFLDRNPTDQAAMEDVFKTISGARAAVNGIHRMMYQFGGDQHYEFGMPSLNMTYDLMGEDFFFYNPQGNGSHFSPMYGWSAARQGTGNGAYHWSFYYRIINNANFIIANIDGVVAEQAEKDEIKAQALTYRAFAYYNLANCYANTYKFDKEFALNDGTTTTVLNSPCVPLYTEPTQEGNPRATVQEVYTQINADLDAAIALFDGANVPRTDKSQIDGAVARGIAARVALVQQNWARAEVMAREARGNYSYMNAGQALSGFNDINNSEWIWGSAINAEQATIYASLISFLDRDADGYASIHSAFVINLGLFDLVDTADVRRYWFISRKQIIDSGAYYGGYQQNEQRKFRVKVPGTFLGDYPLMRASEMALIEAEAMAQQNNVGASALVLENFVKTRQPNFVAPTSNSDTLIKQIWYQRRIELYGEGARYFDIKRQSVTFQRVTLDPNSKGLHRVRNYNAAYAAGVKDVAYDAPSFLWRIPNSELLQNPMLQNP